jgi:hypothetical protein
MAVDLVRSQFIRNALHLYKEMTRINFHQLQVAWSLSELEVTYQGQTAVPAGVWYVSICFRVSASTCDFLVKARPCASRLPFARIVFAPLPKPL